MSRRRAGWALGAVAGGVALFGIAFGAGAMWRARGVLRETGERVAAESIVRFAARPVVPALPAGLEAVGAPAVFRDAQIFHGHLFIAGPTGLAEYDNDYSLVTRYRVGAELPPAPLVALAIGTAGDSGADELWIATSGEGLLAFDGRGFRQIRAEDARFRKITALLAISTGRILLGTEKSGVLVYDGRELKPFHPSLAGVPVTALAGDDTSLWVGTLDRGVLHWNAGALEAIDDALPDRQVLALTLDGDSLYAGTGMGVAEIRGGKFSRTVAAGYFGQSLLASAGRLWMGTLDEGMFEVPLDAHPGRNFPSGRAHVCPDCPVHKILKIDGEVFTLAADSLWRGSREVIQREEAVLADRNIAALAMDGSGRLWIGYFDRGLQILGGERIEDDHLFCVNRITHDTSRGISAVATANGLVMFDASTARRRVITHEDGLIANQVTDVVLRPDGTAVAATPAGVSFIDASGISSIYAFQGLVNNHAYALGSDGARTLVGTLGGLSILDGPMVRASFTTANSALKHNWVTAIVRVNDGWFIGTYGAGVVRMDAAGRLESFDDLRGSLEINQNSMVATGRAVFAGTLDRGLAIYNAASGRWNFWTAGLPSQNVTAVEARGGFVYVGTDNGLVKLPESTLVNP
jgi:ligand-binding sensor domain-containing protein